jgi:hypothetical protein
MTNIYYELFLPNKYTRWYFNIIFNAVDRKLPTDTYTEKHHIIPRCMNGSDDENNLVPLTAREHFICHLLLTKMVYDKNYHYKLCMAVWSFTLGNKNQKEKRDLNLNSWWYEKVRLEVAKYMAEREFTEEHAFYIQYDF